MNWINMLWAILTLLSVAVFISGNRFARYKVRLINYVLFTFIVIYIAESLQTIDNLSKTGYLMRMLTWTIQAAFIAIGLFSVWQRPWFRGPSRRAAGLHVVLSLLLMSCLGVLVL
jgi:hypothetical protein